MAQLSLLNTTWTLHRLSPLHHGKEFPSLLDNHHALKTYAARLRDHLNGTSSVSGATSQTVGASDEADPRSKAGALLSCTWEPIPTLSLSGHTTTTTTRARSTTNPSPSPSPSPSTNNTTANNNNNDPTPSRPRGRPRRPATTPGTPGAGILITLTYETQTYRAALLTPSAASSTSTTSKTTSAPSRSSSHSSSHAPHRTLRSHAHTQTTHLPLLLTKLPAPLRHTFLAFLSATFDTYAASLTLPSGFLGGSLEGYLSCVREEARKVEGGAGVEGGGEEVVGAVVRDVHIMLGFQGPVAPGLRGLDICLPRGVVGGFVWGVSEEDQSAGGDVLGKIAGYLDTHLAMRVDLKEGKGLGGGNVVRVTRVSCGGFMLGADGKMKLVGVAGVGAGAGAGAGQVGAEDEEEDEDEEHEDRGVPPPAAGATVLSLEDRVALRAAEMLLLDVVRRAAGVKGESYGPIEG
ncbi:hypothetical protein ASPACDRAFT_56376 [Aspergillus aculeatus ATCC 16872]|uniref:Uncharacterized protein n=1 Tax=Aspergillus aculeatus (strain ATCC 16872 / CBS 172.66 / WB 5094) TaxID=690307 RepID=A0A1L9X9D5_ASPA1|nr:uncharacterized protein ASPACDRAFT_56376 [Aspergillus aculeatus ATCC 16872]OJK04968.1 hypothetical protein ASPACDRAFT_56376 [Aspergillus aculeatus ATCC 16872]